MPRTEVTRSPEERALQAWMRLALPAEVKVVYAAQGAPRPKTTAGTGLGADYATLQVLQTSERGNPQEAMSDGDFEGGPLKTLGWRQEYDGICRAQFFGPNAFDLARQLMRSVRLPGVRAQLMCGTEGEDGVIPLSVGPFGKPQTVTAAVGTRHERRVVVDLDFAFNLEWTVGEEPIETLDATQTPAL